MTDYMKLKAIRDFADRYAKHDDDCELEMWHGKGPLRCSCGLFKALDELIKKAGGRRLI